MQGNIRISKILWIILALSALFAGFYGVLKPSIYEGVVNTKIEPAVFTQDLVAVIAAVLLFIFAIAVKRNSIRLQAACIGLTGFFLYAYGLYAMEQIYTMLYPLYLFIFSLSLFGSICALAGFSRTNSEAAGTALHVPKGLLITAGVFSILIAVMFNIIWFGELVPLLRTGNRIEYTFSVYIIDLCIIMPSFVISAILAYRGRPIGVIGLPALFIVGAGILSPLALAELIKPRRYALPADTGSLGLFAVLSAAFTVFALVYLFTLRADRKRSG